MNQCLKQFSEMKYRDSKEKSNISTEFCKEFQFLISISRFCGFDELIEFKLQFEFLVFNPSSHKDFCGFAGVWTLLYVESILPLTPVKFYGFVALVLIRANIIWVESKWGLTSKLLNTFLKREIKSTNYDHNRKTGNDTMWIFSLWCLHRPKKIKHEKHSIDYFGFCAVLDIVILL